MVAMSLTYWNAIFPLTPGKEAEAVPTDPNRARVANANVAVGHLVRCFRFITSPFAPGRERRESASAGWVLVPHAPMPPRQDQRRLLLAVAPQPAVDVALVIGLGSALDNRACATHICTEQASRPTRGPMGMDRARRRTDERPAL